MATRWKAIAMGGPDCRYRVGHELSDLPVATRGRALRWWAARAFVSDVLEGCVDESRDPARARLTRNGG
jgi:hypothetical protein